MTNCCNTSQATQPKQHTCPVNGKSYSRISLDTVLHHIDQPWNWHHEDQAYYFCDDPECNVVYFGEDDTIIKSGSLRTKVGVKEQSDTALICYCFGVNKQQAINSPEARTFVIERTQNHASSCTTSNPSGKCCLKNFPK